MPVVTLRGVDLGTREPFLQLEQLNKRPYEPAELQKLSKAAGPPPPGVHEVTEGWKTNVTVLQIPIDGAIMRVVAKLETDSYQVSEIEMHLYGLLEDCWSPPPFGFDVDLTTFILEVTYPTKFYVRIIREDKTGRKHPTEGKTEYGSISRSFDWVVTEMEALSLIGAKAGGKFDLFAWAEVQPDFEALALARMNPKAAAESAPISDCPVADAENSKPRKKRISVEEANEKGKLLLRKTRLFAFLSIREQARQLGCAWETWKKAPLCKLLTKRKAELAAKYSAPTQQSVLMEDDELARIRNEQLADFEPSPLDDSPERFTRPSAAGRRVNRSDAFNE